MDKRDFLWIAAVLVLVVAVVLTVLHFFALPQGREAVCPQCGRVYYDNENRSSIRWHDRCVLCQELLEP